MTELEILRNLFPLTNDYLEERQFTRLHMTVLGLTSHNLEVLLASSIADNADVDASDSEQWTALMWAARRGDATAVDLLLKAKANPRLVNFVGTSVLFHATEPMCVKLLLEAGADPTYISRKGRNALHYAVKHNNKEIIDFLVLGGADVNGRNDVGATPLSYAAIYSCSTAAEALLDRGANINTLDNDGDSPLYQSILSHADDVTQLLLDRGAFHTSINNFGFSLLHNTAMSGGRRTINILLAAKLSDIDPYALDREGKTALQRAQQRETKEEGFVDSFKVLLADITARNTSLQERASRERSADVTSERWLYSWWTCRKPSLNRLLWSTWSSILLYWILGLGWAGFIYMILLNRESLGGSNDTPTERDQGD